MTVDTNTLTIETRIVYHDMVINYSRYIWMIIAEMMTRIYSLMMVT